MQPTHPIDCYIDPRTLFCNEHTNKTKQKSLTKTKYMAAKSNIAQAKIGIVYATVLFFFPVEQEKRQGEGYFVF